MFLSTQLGINLINIKDSIEHIKVHFEYFNWINSKTSTVRTNSYQVFS